MNYSLKESIEPDLSFLLDIFNLYIQTTTISFYTQPLLLDEFHQLIPMHHPKYKTFTIFTEKEIVGFCFYNEYKKRQAYQRTAEVTIYLKQGNTRKGIGSFALRYLEECAYKHQIKVLISIISGENIQSINFFKKQGYEQCAHFKQIGEKFGRILDVIALQKIIQKDG